MQNAKFDPFESPPSNRPKADELAAQLQGEFGDAVKGLMRNAAGRANVSGCLVTRDQLLFGDVMAGVEPMQQEGEEIVGQRAKPLAE